MPQQKSRSRSTERRLKSSVELDHPVIGMEAEFNVWLDEVEINPEPYWKHPKNFIDAPLLKREKTSSHIETGGAVYFDRGVIEVVTPVIEIAPGCTARVVRSLWEQIEYVRDQLTRWGRETEHDVRLKAYSSHYNVSFELKKRDQNRHRNIQKLALLLAYILPVPVMLLAANRRSTGVGVRPRGNRIEITNDFTPDPSRMIATAALIVGIVREVISWPSYELSLIDTLGLPVVDGVVPGKHTTRKGWLTKDFHYPRSPYTCDIDAPIWHTRQGEIMSLREMGRRVAWFFRKSIRRYSDPFSLRLLFAILDGSAPSMLELHDRPLAYEDVGRLCRWGMVLPELQSFSREESLLPVRTWIWNEAAIDEYVAARERERIRMHAELPPPHAAKIEALNRAVTATPQRRAVQSELRAVLRPQRQQRLLPPSGETTTPAPRPRGGNGSAKRTGDYLDRRRRTTGPVKSERRRTERRKKSFDVPFPDRRLTRSAYELVFLKLVSGSRLRIDQETYTPVGMKGWYEAIFRRDSDGSERIVTIDQLLKRMEDWI
jgi:hypothetical protein